MADLPYLQPDKLFFSSFDDKSLKEISVKCITNPISLDRIGTPLPGGLYDPALGPHERNEVCTTCKQFSANCPGHFGHIQLPLPVYNPIYFSYLVAVLRSCCFACNRLLAKDYESHVLALQLRAVRMGYVACAQSIMEVAVSIINRQKDAKEQEVEKGDKAVKEESKTVELSESVVEEIKQSTLAMFEGTVLESSKETSDFSSSNEYLMDLLTTQLKVMSGKKTCPHCAAPVRDVISEGNTKIYLKPLASKRINSWDSALKKPPLPEATRVSPPWHRVSKIVLLTPNSGLAFLNGVRKADSAIYNLLFNNTPPSTMFYSIICVPPVKFRPVSVVNGLKYDNPVSAKLADILSAAVHLSTLLQEQKEVLTTSDVDQGEKFQKIQAAWLRCQSEINLFVVMLKSVLEKKEGLFRMHMMGKRVNYAARSVISPDPFINCDEVGVPMVFATRLTYPQPVTPWNVVELRKAVINGPMVYPGATHVEMEDGKRVLLRADNKTQRESLAKTLLVEDKTRPGYNKKVCRHVRNGDVMLLNRQPTLHKPSIMAHKARVLTNERTLRLHYSVCKSYNADFDGDEMNAHLPQDEISRAEAYGLMGVSDNYLVPKDGKPLGGLIQDHIIAATLLTQRGRYFTKEEYVQFVYLGLIDIPRKIKLLPPSILKPQRMWSGKQIITTILRALVPSHKKLLTLNGKSSTPEKCWINAPNKNFNVNTDDLMDSEVIIHEGELLSGVMDKGQCGAKDFGLVHCVFEIYGGEIATQLLSAFGRLFTSFLSWRGFSLGIEDITVQAHGEEDRQDIIAAHEAKGEEVACKVLGVEQPCDLQVAYQQAHLQPVLYKDLGALDRGARPETAKIETEISRACMGMNLWKKFPHNNLQLMVRSGAKGAEVNCTQISCMVGQVELEGARPPLMLSGRSLPCYLPYDPSLSAGGLITSRFLTGIKPQEMFYNSMAGREGLVDTAVKTSRSGYLQRCLIKHLEGICISYDQTVRDSDGSIVQFLYGNDGIDVTKANFLSPSGLKHLKVNSYILSNNNNKEKDRLNCKDAVAMALEINSIVDPRRRYVSPFSLYEKKMKKKDPFKNLSTNKSKKFRSEQTLSIAESWHSIKDRKKSSWIQKAGRKKPLPVLSTFPPHRYFGSVSEKMQAHMTAALLKEPNKDKLEETVLLRALKALSQPGDSVGVLAGQSVGEPSTQMTLNTFHFAGRAEMNMTMGIPRMREILMTSGANMKTPMMRVPLKLGTSMGTSKQLAKMLTEVHLSQVLEKVDICESIVDDKGTVVQRYRIQFHLLPNKFYADKCYCTPKEVVTFIENIFIGRLQSEFAKLRRAQTSKAAVTADTTKDVPDVIAVANDSDDEGDDERETGGKRNEQSGQIDSYEGDQEEGDTEEVAAIHNIQEEEDGPDLREQNIMKRKAIVSYKYDKVEHLWCEVVMDFTLTGANIMLSSVVEELANKSLVWKIAGIRRAFVNSDKDDKGRIVIVTEGINILEIWKHHEIVDTKDIYTNDINTFCEYYGIEAGMGALISEINEVFGAYGIKVDARHLSLIADYVTQHGVYRPFNRNGIKDGASPFQKVSFETCTEFLRRAAFYNEQDQLKSPSSSIVLGKLGSFGTGACEIRQPIRVCD